MDDVVTGQPAGNKLRAKFFKDGERDYIEITIIGDPCTVLRKVTVQDTQRFPIDWAAYVAGEKEIVIDGSPLTDVPGVDRNLSLAYKLKGVRTAEELAALDEMSAKSLGMGGLTTWQAARNLVRLRQLEALAEAPRRGRPPKVQEEPMAAADS
jgi:hypothetical protein